jgi:ABC-type bacteriocin/lantibiotic exporter with double-glycine peptidase domain
MDINKPIWNNRKIKVPTVIQMENTECGAASLGMVLAYFGKYVSLEELREECAISRNGSKAINIAKAARHYGLEAGGYKAVAVESLKKLPLPIIIFWDFNHFVVLTGIKGNKVYINDPALGPRKIDIEEFSGSFTGFAIYFNKTPEFKTGGKKTGLIKPLLSRLKGSYSSILFLFITGLFLTILGLISPVFQRVFIDNILVGHDLSWINSLLVFIGAVEIVYGIILWFQSNQMLLLQTKIGVNNSADFFLTLLKLPISFFYQRHTGSIVERIGINNQVAALLSAEVSSNLLNIMLIFLYAALMMQYDVLLTIIGVLMAVFSLLYFKFSSARRINISQRLFQENANLVGSVTSGIQVIETIKSTGA